MNRGDVLKYILFITAAGCFCVQGCKGKKKIKKPDQPVVVQDTASSERCRYPLLKTHEIIQKMNQAELNYQSLYLKANCSFTLDNNTEDVDLKIRIIKDSILWVHMDYLSIDIGRIFITKDSLKFINYRQKQYLAEPIDFLSSLMNTEIDVGMLQAAIVGNSAEFYRDDDKIKSFLDKNACVYHLSTHKKRKNRKFEEDKKEPKKILQNISLHPVSFKILSNVFYEPQQNLSFRAEYSDFALSDSVFAPRNVNITLKVDKNVMVKLKYVRIVKNSNARISFQIPGRYERIQIHKD